MKNFQLDSGSYDELLQLLNNQYFTEKPGTAADLNFLLDDQWLRDTAVVEKLVKRAGMWEIHLVFAHYQEPFKLLKRVISKHSSKDKATLHALYIRRLASKDQRGTLKINPKDFLICTS
jgi:hypothetical protein